MKHEEGMRSRCQDEGRVRDRVQEFRILEHAETAVSATAGMEKGSVRKKRARCYRRWLLLCEANLRREFLVLLFLAEPWSRDMNS